MGGPNRYKQTRAYRVSQIGRKEDFSHNDKSKVANHIVLQLEQATARLKEKEAAGDVRGAAKEREIIANLTGTKDRLEKSR